MKKITHQIPSKLSKYCLLMILVCGGISTIQAQSISASDSLYLQSLRNELALTDSQYVHIDSIYCKAQKSIVALDKEIQKTSRSEMNAEEKDAKVKAMAAEKKNLKAMREIDMQLVLTTEQKKKFEEKVKASKNAVSHFGASHDRTSCVVCVPK
jgi:hypothetical protein